MYFKIRIIFIYGVIIIISDLPTSQGSKDCDRLNEKLDLTDIQKLRYNLKKCGGIHDTEGSPNISGGRDKVKRFHITRVSLFF